MKFDIEKLKTLVENGDKTTLETYILSGIEKSDVETVSKTNVEVKSYFDSEKDKHHNVALETWKTNNLNGLIEEEVKKRNPDKSPAEIEIAQLRKEIEDERKAGKREKLMNTAIKQANEKGLPVDILDYFVSDDEETTTANLAKLEEAYNKAVQASVEAKFKENGRTVPSGQGNAQAGSIKSITEMAAEHNLRNQNN
jgi:hypothetical protein